MNTNLTENTNQMKKTEQEQNGYTYPYIPKKIYPAVMYACKMIRENGYFNKAIRAASNYYGIDEDAITEHVRKRIAAGKKAKYKPFRYKYFVVEDRLYNADRCINECLRVYVKHAKDAYNFERDEEHAYAALLTRVAEGSSRDGYESLSEAVEVGRKLAEENDVDFIDKIKEASKKRAASRTMNSLKKKASQYIEGQGAYGQLTLVEVNGRWATYENETGIVCRWFDWHSETMKVGGKSRAIVRDNGKYNIVDDNDNLLCKTWYDGIRLERQQPAKDAGSQFAVRKGASADEKYADLLKTPSREDIIEIMRTPEKEYFVATLNGNTIKLDKWGNAWD